MDDCLFCKIAAGAIPAQTVYADEDVLAFRDIEPAAPVHLLVVPRKHIANLSEASESDEQLLGRLARVAAQVAEAQGIAVAGYRVVINNGSDAQQSVRHIHLHVMGGRQFGWPPG